MGVNFSVLSLRPMKCPHCNTGIHPTFANTQPFVAGPNTFIAKYLTCPECKKGIVNLVRTPREPGASSVQTYAYPLNKSTRNVPLEVPDPYKQDFIEACAVLSRSARASGALSRRTLQAILRDKSSTTKKDLYDQIEEVIQSHKLPSHIEEGLHAVRNIGNFATHPIKSTSTGEIVEVEPGEAEWNLDVLESLFDFYFVQPALTAKRKAELNKKLKEAGKPPI